MLKMHNEVEKWVNVLLIQMRTQKIDFNDFLYHFRISSFDSSKCWYNYNYHIVKHVFMKCRLYNELKQKI